MDAQHEKAQMRKQVLAKRDALAIAERIELGLTAAAHGADSLSFEHGVIISGFFPIRSEIDPRPLMDRLRIKGARLCLPVVLDKTTIVFRELSRTAELVDTGFGTRGPGPGSAELDPDILIMPLSVFDHYGGRIGYGAGHYDRAVRKLVDKGMQPKLIGMAFDCQHLPKVPVEPHDQLLDGVLTESGFHETRPAGRAP